MSAIQILQAQVDKVIGPFVGEYLTRVSKPRGSKIIRDYDEAFHEIPAHALPLIDAPFFQRLRYQAQNSLASLTYPSAVHARFQHSLGVYSLTKRLTSAALQNSDETIRGSIPPHELEEVHLAALLHDTGHGPFSHASEDIFRHDPIFHQIQQENPDRFAEASASEILTHALLNSPALTDVWALVDEAWKTACPEADRLDPARISAMIMGSRVALGPVQAALGAIVNGPVDADKLDYINRDAAHAGLGVRVDVPRILSATSVQLIDKESAFHDLALAYSSVPAIEQVIFAKIQLYSQVYLQHKVRAAAHLAYRLIEVCYRTKQEVVPGLTLQSAASFLVVDDLDMLRPFDQNPEAHELVHRIRNRRLPRRSLVIGTETLEDGSTGESQLAWYELSDRLADSFPDRRKAEEAIAERSGVDSNCVFLDFPPQPKLKGTLSAIVAMPDGQCKPLSKLFPAPSYGNAYIAYRGSVSHVFVDGALAGNVATGAASWLSDEGVQLNPLASAFARD